MYAVFKPNSKNGRCAFCKYWYDPTNEHIIPSNPKQGYWKFDTAAKCVCLKNNLKMGAGMRCSKYECKI